MRVPAQESERGTGANSAASSQLAARSSRAAAVLALQRRIGNRASARIVARWIKHPDQDKKGVMVPDVVAAEYARFNPPKNE